MPAEIQAASPTEAEGAQPSPRADMKAYWDEHSATNTTVEAMMLDEGAKDIDKLERPEILGMLPDLTGLDMVELGAGIGRLTGDLAARAKSVIACDFIEASIKKNEEMHASLGNVEFLCADATKMDLPAGSLDVVFSNWLLMYFDDREVEELFAKALKWLKPGGFLFFRESCFHKSGNALRTDNPTVYRTPAQYHAMVTKQVDSARSESGMPSVFNLISQKTVTSYVEVKDNHNQIAWLYQKTSADLPAHQTRGMHLQSFLDTHRYTPEVIAAYERIYGAGFVSSGGRETTCELIESLALQPGEKVLDVGCGIGGGWQSLAYDYGVTVHGIDLSVNMVNSALERREVREGVKQLVSFEVADVMQRDFEPESFDVIYSRDSIMHAEDKPAIFARMLRWLKPGGRIVISDYCCGKDALHMDFDNYVNRRGYFLVSPERYGELVGSVGFRTVSAEDRTAQLITIMEKELSQVQQPENKASFVEEFGSADYYELIAGWSSKLKWAAAGQFKYGVITAVKPASEEADPPADGAALVDCSRVTVKNDKWGGAGAFAACDIAAGEVVEKGIVRVLTDCDGNVNPYVFTWSDELPNVTWAIGSGCSTFYNTGEEDVANTHMERDFGAKSFVITATMDIKAGAELLHVYKSKKWRTCFKDDLNPSPESQ